MPFLKETKTKKCLSFMILPGTKAERHANMPQKCSKTENEVVYAFSESNPRMWPLVIGIMRFGKAHLCASVNAVLHVISLVTPISVQVVWSVAEKNSGRLGPGTREFLHRVVLIVIIIRCCTKALNLRRIEQDSSPELFGTLAITNSTEIKYLDYEPCWLSKRTWEGGSKSRNKRASKQLTST
jgi:hypothetical protein